MCHTTAQRQTSRTRRHQLTAWPALHLAWNLRHTVVERIEKTLMTEGPGMVAIGFSNRHNSNCTDFRYKRTETSSPEIRRKEEVQLLVKSRRKLQEVAQTTTANSIEKTFNKPLNVQYQEVLSSPWNAEISTFKKTTKTPSQMD